LKKKTILLLLGLITCLSFSFSFKASYGAFSQDWVAIEDYKNDYPTCLGIDSSGNIYVAGYMDNINGTSPDMQYYRTDIFLLKYDSLGGKQWNRTYHASKRDMCNDLILDSQDNVYLVGYTKFDNHALLLLKYNSSGHLLWNKTCEGSSIGTNIEIDSFDNIFVSGNMGDAHFFLQKYDTSGNLLWNQTWKNSAVYEASAMALDLSSNIFLVSRINIDTNISNIIYNIFLAKYNSLGEYQWNFSCQTPRREFCRDILVDSADNIYILGKIEYDLPARSEIRLLKYDNSGNSLWNATWGNDEKTYDGRGLAIDASNNIYITGCTHENEILILKYNSTGVLKWNFTHGIRERDTGSAIKIDSSENIYVCGTTYKSDYPASCYDSDAFLLKLSEAESNQAFISSYNLLIVILSVFGIGIAFYIKKRKSFLYEKP
jgi:hypothetical protein